MTGPVGLAEEHHDDAVRLLKTITVTKWSPSSSQARADLIATAQVHATLAVASSLGACWQELHRLRNDHHPKR